MSTIKIPTLDDFNPTQQPRQHLVTEAARKRALDYYYENREKVLAKQKIERDKHPEISRERCRRANQKNAGKRPSDYSNGGRDRFLKRKYGISANDYDALLKKQGGGCAICASDGCKVLKKSGVKKRLAVDHCHVTGRVRGLLCEACNTAIGLLKDSLELLASAAEYLRAPPFSTSSASRCGTI